MNTLRLPSWLTKKLPSTSAFESVRKVLRANRINTVCENAKCPNIFECYGKGSVTFILLGNECTRKCRYCTVSKEKPLPPDIEEPDRIAETVRELSLSYVVITSVTRDDLEDFGAREFARSIGKIREKAPGVTIEVLTPDFRGDVAALDIVLSQNPDIFGHNIETVAERFSALRPEGNYATSLGVLEYSSKRGFVTKSGIMVGLGETRAQLARAFRDLHTAGARIITIGQYLKPSNDCADVSRYYTPDEFHDLRALALQIGFKEVTSGPFVRSSYRLG